MKPAKNQRWKEFMSGDEHMPALSIKDKVLDVALSRIAFEGAELSDKLYDRIDAKEQTAETTGEEFKPGLVDKVAIGIANILDGPL